MRERPSSFIVGRQRWSALLFAHWKMAAQTVQATLPPGLFVDTFEGEAYVGIVPFFMERVRPAWLPPLPWMSWFLELNVRTYVHDAAGQPGVWFYSLDCNQPVAVAIARRFFHLPYFHARMSAKRRDGAIHFHCQRRGESGESWRYEWRPGPHASPAEPGTLEFFLIERYVLFSSDRERRLHEGRVHHAPYRIHTPTVSQLSAGPAHLAGFDLEGDPASLLGAGAKHNLRAPGLLVHVEGRRPQKEPRRAPGRPKKGWIKAVMALLIKPELVNAPPARWG